ncbi:ABC transporter substrate-binding protein [Alkalihalophilus pseudofirmus]|nr:ABC transporter substrate-binding protein [Alkalihalophilus pseudofirmus]
MKAKLVVLFMILIAVFTFIGCASSGNEEVSKSVEENEEKLADEQGDLESQTVTFEDSTGREITLELPLERVVVINRNTAEALKVLGVDEQIVATGDTTIENNSYLGFDDRPDVGKTSEVNLEQIISLEPDVVFTYTNRPDFTLEEKLEPAGIAVVRLNNYLPDQMDQEIQLLGTLFDKEDEATAFLEWKEGLETKLAERVNEIPEDEKKQVMALSVGFLNSQGGYRIFPSETTEGEPGVGEGFATILAGGIDAADVKWDASEESTTILVDEEYVLEKNPEVLTLHGTWLGGYETEDAKEHEEVYQNIINSTSVHQLKAYENKDIFIYHTNLIGSDKRYIGVMHLAKDLYPDRFADIDPEQYAREYFENWLGVEYKGVWYYSPKQ